MTERENQTKTTYQQEWGKNNKNFVELMETKKF